MNLDLLFMVSRSGAALIKQLTMKIWVEFHCFLPGQFCLGCFRFHKNFARLSGRIE
jgi:hypothetical protein